jgi:hypothetical protein
VVGVVAALMALAYCIRRQRDRRNLTAKELGAFVARAVETLDRVKPEGRPSKTASVEAAVEAVSGRSSEQTAASIGVSRAQVERTRAVLASDNEETKEKLRDGHARPCVATLGR